MPRKASSEAHIVQKHRLTLTQLASHDDVLTDALIDQAYFWSRIRKNRENKYLPVRGIKQDEVPQILLHQVIIAKDVEGAEKSLLSLAGLRRYLGCLRTESEKKDFRNHLRKYVNMYLPDCPFEVSTTNRYTVVAHEAAITARKRIREGDKIKYLCGTLVPLTDAELEDLDLTQRNFSIVQSDRKKNTLIFLGPARFANHDCVANGRLVSVGKDGLEVHATRNIEIGEEITVTYSPGYFGANNEECLCHTCELEARSGWTSPHAFRALQSSESTPTAGNSISDTPYSFRKKREHGSMIQSRSSEPSPSLSKRQKRGRPPSRLNQALTPPSSSASFEVEPLLLADHKDEHASPTRALAQIHQPDEEGCWRSDADIISIGFAEAAGPVVENGPPRKERLRLIDQETSSPRSSPEMSSITHLCSSVSEDDGSNYSLSKPSSSSTRATTIAEAAVVLRKGSPGGPRVDSNETLPKLLDPVIPTIRTPDLCLPSPSTEAELSDTNPATTHDTLVITKCDDDHNDPNNPSNNSILPSIEEVPIPDLDASMVPTTSTIPSAATTPPVPISSTTIRTPGDYILTRRLITQPFDRWVQCQSCQSCFLQSNGYQTRRECPRCERHSMLYGFRWPKTEPDARRLKEMREAQEKEENMARSRGCGRGRGRGKGIGETIVVNTVQTAGTATRGQRGRKRGGQSLRGRGRSGRSGKGSWVEGGGEEEREERVMDHRTVNRFVAPEEEREVRRRGRDFLLDHANRPTGNGSENGIDGYTAIGKYNNTITASDQILPARIRGSTAWNIMAERGWRSCDTSTPREDSVDSASGLDDVEASTAHLRRSRRYFAFAAAM